MMVMMTAAPAANSYNGNNDNGGCHSGSSIGQQWPKPPTMVTDQWWGLGPLVAAGWGVAVAGAGQGMEWQGEGRGLTGGAKQPGGKGRQQVAGGRRVDGRWQKGRLVGGRCK